MRAAPAHATPLSGGEELSRIEEIVQNLFQVPIPFLKSNYEADLGQALQQAESKDWGNIAQILAEFFSTRNKEQLQKLGGQVAELIAKPPCPTGKVRQFLDILQKAANSAVPGSKETPTKFTGLFLTDFNQAQKNNVQKFYKLLEEAKKSPEKVRAQLLSGKDYDLGVLFAFLAGQGMNKDLLEPMAKALSFEKGQNRFIDLLKGDGTKIRLLFAPDKFAEALQALQTDPRVKAATGELALSPAPHADNAPNLIVVQPAGLVLQPTPPAIVRAAPLPIRHKPGNSPAPSPSAPPSLATTKPAPAPGVIAGTAKPLTPPLGTVKPPPAPGVMPGTAKPIRTATNPPPAPPATTTVHAAPPAVVTPATTATTAPLRMPAMVGQNMGVTPVMPPANPRPAPIARRVPAPTPCPMSAATTAVHNTPAAPTLAAMPSVPMTAAATRSPLAAMVMPAAHGNPSLAACPGCTRPAPPPVSLPTVTSAPAPTRQTSPTVVTQPAPPVMTTPAMTTPAMTTPVDPNAVAMQARNVLGTYCYKCHGDPARYTHIDFKQVLNRDFLIQNGYIKPGKPDESPLLQDLEGKGEILMPPRYVNQRPSPQEIALVRAWIAGGAKPWGNAPITKPVVAGTTTVPATPPHVTPRGLASTTVPPVQPAPPILTAPVMPPVQPAPPIVMTPATPHTAVGPTATPSPIPSTAPSTTLTRPDLMLGNPVTATNLPPSTEDQILRLVAADLAAQPAASRPFLRYFSLRHLQSLLQSGATPETQKAALARLINYLSTGNDIVKPQAIDPEGTIFRVDMRQLGWTKEMWQKVRKDSPFFKHAAPGLRQAAALTERGDRFVALASRGDLYRTFLNLNGAVDDIGDVYRNLGVHEAADLRNGKAKRAGIIKSGTEANNRLIQRVEQGKTDKNGNPLYCWRSFNFDANKGKANLFTPQAALAGVGNRNGLPFADSDNICQLPNGLQMFFTVDKNGAITADANADTGAKCMRCHVNGLLEADDAVRGAALARQELFSPADLALIRKLYPNHPQFKGIVGKDNQPFRQAIASLNINDQALGQDPIVRKHFGDPVNAASEEYNAPLSLQAAAAEAGLTPAQLLERIQSVPQLKRNLGSLLVGNAAANLAGGGVNPKFGGAVRRDLFEENFATIVNPFGNLNRGNGNRFTGNGNGQTFRVIERSQDQWGRPITYFSSGDPNRGYELYNGRIFSWVHEPQDPPGVRTIFTPRQVPQSLLDLINNRG